MSSNSSSDSDKEQLDASDKGIPRSADECRQNEADIKQYCAATFQAYSQFYQCIVARTVQTFDQNCQKLMNAVADDGLKKYLTQNIRRKARTTTPTYTSHLS